MDLKLHDTLSGEKRLFRPLIAGAASLYVCGITPYDEPHVGHARCYVLFDLLKRVLTWHGYRVRHVQNFTDIDDKIIARANEMRLAPWALAEANIAVFFEMMDRLNVARADLYPRVTTSMPEIIRRIADIVENGNGYVADGDVLFSVRSYPEYGKLSKRNVDDLRSGARIEVGQHKRDPLDFALWKKAKTGEPAWDSPWGRGRPGWHIECSAMSLAALGDAFDVHGGGQDLIFPHHENEIAQTFGATAGRAEFGRFWVHNGFVMINKEKMSKSLGNFFTLREVLARYDPMAVRYFLLSQHYRSPLNFSDIDLDAAQTTWTNRIAAAYGKASERAGNNADEPGTVMEYRSFDEALADDLNTPVALAELHDVCGRIFKNDSADPAEWRVPLGRLSYMLERLGFTPPAAESWPADVLALVDERQAARKEKNWGRSDEIRDALKARGVTVEDTASGPRLKRI